ncbi:Uma2 family endonuclease [Pleurocapsa sp. PCC 7319]|uniref:Uma2 family endonuclease n=1 Tax=Pleurocapsa sp. PCC 7319 TaxID=118161 RepID=UPI00034B2821|nr:Uma2 family endonuclease [Pleurocapsa sp. PCC 7319]
MTYTINVKAFTEKISDRALEQLCRENPDLRFETDAKGKLIIMSPIGSESGKRNSSLVAQVWYWNRQSKLGVVFDSSTGFKLSNGATRSPDVSWIAIERWDSLSDKQKRGFAPIDPDFVIELMSPTDDLATTQNKMSEYINCGVKLGWLINPDEKQVEIYRLEKDKQVVINPSSLSSEDILPGLTMDFSDIFSTD